MKVNYKDIGSKHKKCTCIEIKCKHKTKGEALKKEYDDFDFNEKFLV